jgi:hypothetical protein
VAVLSDRLPQIVVRLVEREPHRVHVPLVARSQSAVPPRMGRGRPTLPAPRVHRRIREEDATCGHQRFAIAVAQADAAGAPDTVADHLCGNPLARIQGEWWHGHAAGKGLAKSLNWIRLNFDVLRPQGDNSLLESSLQRLAPLNP